MGGIVGGMFGLARTSAAVPNCEPPFLRQDDLTFVNGRSALDFVLTQLRPRLTWLPSFLCPVLVEIAGRHCEIRYYDPLLVTREGDDAWTGEVEAGDVALFIDYFGFQYPREGLQRAMNCGAIVIEDACQSLLTQGVGVDADFVVYSPRKFLGVVDGGILSARSARRLSPVDWQPLPDDWWHIALTASRRRAEFDVAWLNQMDAAAAPVDRDWFTLYQKSEATAPAGPFPMSDVSRLALTKQFDYSEIARVRRENYLHLAGRLSPFMLLPLTGEATVPLGFPIVAENRDEVQRALFGEEIYPPIHWKIEGIVPPACTRSHELARRILTLPCDQRYDADTMERISRIVNAVARPCRREAGAPRSACAEGRAG